MYSIQEIWNTCKMLKRRNCRPKFYSFIQSKDNSYLLIRKKKKRHTFHLVVYCMLIGLKDEDAIKKVIYFWRKIIQLYHLEKQISS